MRGYRTAERKNPNRTAPFKYYPPATTKLAVRSEDPFDSLNI